MPDMKPMGGMPPKPEPSGAGAPTPTPAPRGGGLKKAVGLVLAIVVLGGGGSMWWHGKKLGEANAKKAGKPIAEAKTVMPWDWSSEDWRAWYGDVKETGAGAGDAISQKADALKAKIASWRQSKTAATPASVPASDPKATGTTPAPATPASNPDATPATPSAAAPAGFDDASKLVQEGSEAWEKHDYPTAKAKLLEAQKQLQPMTQQSPVHPDVAKAAALTKDLLEDIEMNSPH